MRMSMCGCCSLRRLWLTSAYQDPSRPNFSWVLVFSVFTGMARPGVTLFALEKLHRNLNRREVRMAEKDDDVTNCDFPQMAWFSACESVALLHHLC
jgi:hypothetical protein